MATIENGEGYTSIIGDGCRVFYETGARDRPLLCTDWARTVTVSAHGGLTLHLTRDDIRELAALLAATEEHFEALETWEEEQAYEDFCRTLETQDEMEARRNRDDDMGGES